MGMRRTASILALIGILSVVCCLSSVVRADDCYYNRSGRLICDIAGTHPGGPNDPPPRDRPPIRYLYTATDPVVGDCHYWSRTPGGLDTWNPANEAEAMRIATTTPVCPVASDPPGVVAWRIFRSFPLALPTPSLEPPVSGITGLPTYLSTPDPADITHSEILPDGRRLEVRARVSALAVNWGDGARASFDPEGARPYPEGDVTHTYTTKTCDAAYRQEHPSGGNCHPTLDAYPLTATFTWAGSYRVGGAWIYLGTLDRTATVTYDVDEVQGVLQQ